MPLMHYCPACGQALPAVATPPGSVVSQACAACGAIHYRNAKPTAGALLVRDGKLLLGRRGVEPFRGWWDIPGGFLEPWEHPVEGLVRELREETGLAIQVGALFDVGVDAYGDHGDYTINFYYLASAPAGEPQPADDVTELRWFAPDALPEQIAFAASRDVLRRWQAQLAASRLD